MNEHHRRHRLIVDPTEKTSELEKRDGVQSHSAIRGYKAITPYREGK